MAILKSCSIDSEIALIGDDLLSEIIVRLPFKSVARSACVSKDWRAAVSDDYLRRRLPLLMTTVYFPDDDAVAAGGGGGGGPRFACAASDGNDGHRLEDCHLGFLPERGGVVVCDGCNGLLLCRSPGTPEFFVVDPVTRRWAALPAPAKAATLSVLAFDPSTSPDYRVVNFTGWRDRGAAVEVFSSATWAWTARDTEFGGVPASSLSGSMHYHDGILYILASEPDCLVSLNLADFSSTAAVIDLPEPVDGGDAHVAHSGGRLHYIFRDGELLKVWELDDDDQWRPKHAVKVEHLAHGGGEVRFLAMHPEEEDVVYTWSPWKVVEHDLRRKTTTCHCQAWEFGEGERNRVVKAWLVPSSCYLSDCLAHCPVKC
ncbi:putative F-box/kelch-repeat protein At1g15680 [Oryza sativa Japonica Group]|uniref:Os08g0529300 protein n=2 Tax=Oryza sativa subsp. japonica TaxID=39947 RepID=A0A5S6RCC1_ORYSJ|nr:putative F-box/kelch-repeat protein At1g15680 [Oryza sativa Japonica Group]EAZ43434.1 hypothetical protein OsJ_28039 [Oryza sativa Japonica Group]KAF2920624.1 hypothetical protein DAI22_08g223700 [Oryza sativa Japonica Group]USI00620.1 F-box domain-containing protein [Oryza sativa Japonica Group]BAD09108.1 hypothetical protein [Oryza sativa Japonica Group]BAF24234.2 Os08g0529300 [Oryza sativa Japonica Group]|eukprot:NP_001062320.2 Os08g0529300 [Oryza sativa Japonica Group]